MAFRPSEKLPDFASLKVILTNAQEQIKNFSLYQTIFNFLDASGRSQRILNSRVEDLEAGDVNLVTDVRDAGYWSPLVLSLDPGDSELVLSDTGAPIMVWVPTP